MKQLFLIDLQHAMDLETVPPSPRLQHNDRLGLLIDGMTLEQFRAKGGSWEDLAELGIQPVKKNFLADAVKAINFPHDKLEGLWFINSNTLGLINDDDFGITSNGKYPISKTLDKAGIEIDHSTVYQLKVDFPQ